MQSVRAAFFEAFAWPGGWVPVPRLDGLTADVYRTLGVAEKGEAIAMNMNRFGIVGVLLASLAGACGGANDEGPPPPPPPSPALQSGQTAAPPPPPPGAPTAQAQASAEAPPAPPPPPAAPPTGEQAPAQPAQSPPPADAQAQATPTAPPPPQSQWVYSYPTGQWVYTTSYGWVWVPAGAAAQPIEGVPYSYLYTPAYGWTWYISPWGWGGYHYGPWVRHAWAPVGWRGGWVAHPHVFVRLGGHGHFRR
jgi:hypothetical protein